MAAGAGQRHSHRVRLLLADRVFQAAADHRDHQLPADRRERRWRSAGELCPRFLERIRELAAEGQCVEQDVLGERLVRGLQPLFQVAGLRAQLRESVRPGTACQLV